MEELAGHRGRQRDLGHQQQRAAAQRDGGVDRLQVYLGFPRAGDAFEQKRMKLAAAQRRFNLLVRFQLMRIERSGRDIGGEDAGGRFRFERDQVAPRQRTRGLACALHRCFQLLQVVRAGVQFQERVQLALALGQLQALGRTRTPLPTTTARSRVADARNGSRCASRSSIATKPFFSSDRITFSAFGNFFCR